ncbi:histidinol-phosphate transaminase [Derxia gummosa]|uniref:Histidinol-phosphate aminotransferase n=1 Tax=Derxia gummosa DSM 723 TaxID=1121388 RepID=A0A8B6X7U1_9BURK|nr:histidinol-phosphate transaminase [Derxia gummosa]
MTAANPYWSALTHRLVPYVPGEQPKVDGLVKLNTNENPYPPSPKAIAAIAEAAGRLALYPDPESTELRAAVAERHGLGIDNVFAGNGSDEVLGFAFMALLKHEQPLLFPDISYSFYPVYCGLFGIEYRTVPLRDDFSLALDDYTQSNGGIVFPNPNAPTGRALPLADIEALLRRNTGSVVLVDEAYVDFGAESAAGLVRKYPNLLVTQTLSKSRSLAGLRVGFAIGDAGLIEALRRVKDSFNSYPVDRLAAAGAAAAMRDEDYFAQTRDAVIATRERLVAELAKRGFTSLPSAANFIFTTHASRPADELLAELRARKVLVRRFSAPRIANWLRITVGSDEQCAALLAALDGILG